jgi:microcystin-dependent protein
MPNVGEIVLFAQELPPPDFARCDGQLMIIAEHRELFSLIGTSYGGDGVTTFALPDLRDRAPTGLPPAGAASPHNHRQPYLALNFCILLRGEYPQFDPGPPRPWERR